MGISFGQSLVLPRNEVLLCTTFPAELRNGNLHTLAKEDIPHKKNMPIKGMCRLKSIGTEVDEARNGRSGRGVVDAVADAGCLSS
jgi:hypothetical protein